MPGNLILPNEYLAIAEEELRQGKSVEIQAHGASMYPFIHGADDVVEVVPLPPGEPLKVWRAYMFMHKGQYIIHRLIGIDGETYRMLGDGNLRIEERVKRDSIIGLLKNIRCSDGKIIDATTSRWMMAGKMWHRMLPLRRYLLAVCRRLSRYGLMR